MWLSAWEEFDWFGNSLCAVASIGRGSSSADKAIFDLASAAAAITINGVSVVARKNKFLSITADLCAEVWSGLEVESETATVASVAVNAGCAAGQARKTSELLSIPVGSSRASNDNRIYWVGWVGWVSWVSWGCWNNNGFCNALASIPNFSGLAGDAGDSIIVWWGRAWSNAVSVVVNAVSSAVSARSSNKGYSSVAQVVVFRSGGNINRVGINIPVDVKFEGASCVSKDESSDSTEHNGGIGGIEGYFIRWGGKSDVFIINVAQWFNVSEGRIEGNIGNKERVNLGGGGGGDE